MRIASLRWRGPVAGVLLAIAIAVAGTSCGDDADDVAVVPTAAGPETGPFAAPADCDLPRRADLCDYTGCGATASYVTGAALDALSVRGCRNRDGVRLLPDTLYAASGRGCPAGAMRLDVVDGELVGRAAGGQTVCSGAGLAGATFWLEGPPARLPLGPAEHVMGMPSVLIDVLARADWRIELRIDRVRAGEPGAYRITSTGRVRHLLNGPYWTENMAPIHDPIGLCDDAERRMAGPTWRRVRAAALDPRPTAASPSTLRLDVADLVGWPLLGASSPAAGAGDRHALLVGGEVYDVTGNLVREGDDWFHLACAGSPLASARLRGYQRGPSSTADQRVANLKMTMGVYCDRSRVTAAGTVLVREDPTASTVAPPAAADAPATGPLEARWTARGASCIGHSRLWHAGEPPPFWVAPDVLWPAGEPEPSPARSEQAFRAYLQATCAIPDCASAPTGADEHFATYAVDHLAD